MRALRIFRLAVLAIACAAAILAGDAVGQAEYWLRRRAARRRLRRWQEIRARRAEWERAASTLRRYQCLCECHVVRDQCGPCCEERS